MGRTRALREDSIRNRGKILAAAREQIGEHGPEVGMSQIAAAAGVAVGTLYRHFPTKADLVAAVIGEYMDRVAEDAEAALRRVVAGASGFLELTGLLERVLEESAAVNAVKAVAATLGADEADPSAAHRTTEALGEMIRRAKGQGQIRADLTVEDLFLLGGSAPVGLSSAARHRWVSLVMNGVTEQSATGPNATGHNATGHNATEQSGRARPQRP